MFNTILTATPTLFSDTPNYTFLRIGIISLTIIIAIVILIVVLKGRKK